MVAATSFHCQQVAFDVVEEAGAVERVSEMEGEKAKCSWEHVES